MTSDNRHWLKRWGGTALALALLSVAGWLTSRQLREMDWADVSAKLAGYGSTTLAMALLAALIGYIAVSQFDLVGRHYTGHKLPVRRVLAISFIGYTFSLNLGGMIGGLGFRYRLYSSAGLPLPTATKVIGLSVLGNWAGYVLLAGLLFTVVPPQLPASWSVGLTLLRVVGILLLLTTSAYIWLCWRHAGRTWEIKSFTLMVPSLRIAVVQFALSMLSWCANATIIFILLPDGIGWFMVVAALITSVTAALLAHVPGGIGVIELVFIALLGHLAPESTIVAAMLVYRCIYYLLPLLVAVLLYMAIEITHARAASRIGAKRHETA